MELWNLRFSWTFISKTRRNLLLRRINCCLKYCSYLLFLRLITIFELLKHGTVWLMIMRGLHSAWSTNKGNSFWDCLSTEKIITKKIFLKTHSNMHCFPFVAWQQRKDGHQKNPIPSTAAVTLQDQHAQQKWFHLASDQVKPNNNLQKPFF